jgi:hypothetical protein
MFQESESASQREVSPTERHKVSVWLESLTMDEFLLTQQKPVSSIKEIFDIGSRVFVVDCAAAEAMNSRFVNSALHDTSSLP